MAMLRLPDLVNKVNFRPHLAANVSRIANFPEYPLAPSQEWRPV
ncbi:Uncharacterised protein [Citrobacter koseri]|nr:Uncharacterised protein [Citrobacter koseri]STT19929.1 Uncharacterised protein [Citrobacter koseri]